VLPVAEALSTTATPLGEVPCSRTQPRALPGRGGTNIVDRGLKVLFFGLFCYFSVFFPLDPLEEAK